MIDAPFSASDVDNPCFISQSMISLLEGGVPRWSRSAVLQNSSAAWIKRRIDRSSNRLHGQAAAPASRSRAQRGRVRRWRPRGGVAVQPRAPDLRPPLTTRQMGECGHPCALRVSPIVPLLRLLRI